MYSTLQVQRRYSNFR